MNGLSFPSRAVFGAAALLAGGALATSPATAQIGGGGGFVRYQQQPESRVLLLTTLRGPDRRTNVQATDVLATQIRTRIQAKEVYLLPKNVVEDVLRQSQFAVDTALSPLDARLLGRTLRADEFLDAYVEPGPGGRGYQMRGRLYLAADHFLNDKLPDPEPGDNLQRAADALIVSFREVRKQLPHERECTMHMSEGRYVEAEAAARAGVRAYPAGTIVRRCLLAAISAQRKGPDAILTVAREILAQDSLNRHGLAYAVDAYREKDDTANFVSHAARLVAVDITNAALVENIVQTLAEMQRADVALPTVNRAIEASPLEGPLHKLRVLLLIGAERWKEAAERSEELLRLDPEAADSAFFVRLSVAYRNDSQPEKAADALGRAAERFPQNAFLRLLYGQELGRTGRTEEAIAAYKAALEIDPKLQSVRTFIALGYQQLNQLDSTLTWLRNAHAAQEDSATIAGMARTMGGRLLQTATQSKELADFQRAVPPLAFADSVSANNEGKWWWTLAEYHIASKYIEQLQQSPSCDVAQKAKHSVELLPLLIRGGGGQVDGAAAGQIMGAYQEFLRYVEGQIAEHCKTGP